MPGGIGRVVGLRTPVWVTVAGISYEVPPRTFQRWVAARIESLPFLGLLDIEVAIALNARTYDRDDPIDTDDLQGAWREAIVAHSGLPTWWEAERLLLASADSFDVVSGEATWRGLDLLEAPLDRALLFVRTLVYRGAEDEKARRRLEQEFTTPPAEEVQAKRAAPRPGFTPEEQGAAWAGAARGTGVRS